MRERFFRRMGEKEKEKIEDEKASGLFRHIPCFRNSYTQTKTGEQTGDFTKGEAGELFGPIGTKYCKPRSRRPNTKVTDIGRFCWRISVITLVLLGESAHIYNS